MKRWKSILLTVVLALVLTAPAYADWDFCPPGQEKKGWKCVDIEEPNGSGDVTQTTEVDVSNRNTNMNANLNTNLNNNENKNVNKNTNLNTNLNMNTNKQSQGQDQDQAQGQIQGQSQGQDQDQDQDQVQGQMQGNINTIKIEADKREHIQGHAAPVTDAKVADTKASKIRGKGSLLDRVEFLTMSMAKHASKNASDMDVEAAVLFENDFELDRIKVGQGEVFGGYIYVFSDGTDSYLAAMDAEASETAMKLGMTHIIRLGEVELTKVLDGSSWNIGFSGGASLMTSGEDVAIAPNGGLGYGKARTSSEFRPDAVYEVSYSAGLVRVK